MPRYLNELNIPLKLDTLATLQPDIFELNEEVMNICVMFLTLETSVEGNSAIEGTSHVGHTRCVPVSDRFVKRLTPGSSVRSDPKKDWE